MTREFSEAMMRFGLCSGVLSVLLALSSPAWAQDEEGGKGDKKAGAAKAEGKASAGAGASMESVGGDPVNTETADEGRFAPKGHTGKEAAKKEEVEAEKPLKVKPGKGVFGELLIGFGDAPLELGGGEDMVHGTSYGFLVGGHYDLSTRTRLMLRVPWTTGRIENADGVTESESALGTPEIAGRMHLSEPKRLTLSLQLAIGIPVAQGNPDLNDSTDPSGIRKGKLQQFQNAANGYREPELFMPKRIPITPAFIARYKRGRFMAGGEAKIVFAPKIAGDVSEPNADDGTYTLNGVAIIGVLGGDAAYEIIRKVNVGLRAWLAYNAIRPYDFESDATEPSDLQFVLEPRIFAKFGMVSPSLGVLLPVGGELGGNINGVRLHVNVDF